MRLDAHQHFWSYDENQYPWIPKGSPLHRDWLPDDLAREQARVGMEGSIAVQARQTAEESRWLLTLADESPIVQGVVGWVDLRSNEVEEQMADLAHHPKFRGVRHVVQDEPDDRFMLGAEFLRGIGKLRQFGLTYDILIYPKQLPAAIELAQRFPDQPFVLDHIAKPHIREGTLSPWREQIRELAQVKNVFCKVSGMVTEANHATWKAEDFQPYLDVIFETFGTERLMWGSDWPVCLFAADYEQVFKLVKNYSRHLSPEERDGLFGSNAARFYSICG
ncbi:amidohydrolase family protein [Verrucomicrobiota bacterium sgz303538]